jgi:alkylation response protein AidB-like acyl-CoA dehydrogenase
VDDAIAKALRDALDRLGGLDLGDRFEPRAAATIVDVGLHRLCVPTSVGGLGASMVDAAEVLLALGALDGSTALGFAMQAHVVGGIRDSPDYPAAIRDAVFRAIVDQRALLNNAATETGGGSPARGAIPGTTARAGPDGRWRLTGEKTWTTWLPNLTHAFVSARIENDEGSGVGDGASVTTTTPGGAETPEIGQFLVDLSAGGIERRAGFEALGMCGSASGRLVLEHAPGALVGRRAAGTPDPRGTAPAAWFGVMVAATYLGVGEGARTDVARWALERRPGDGSSAVAEIPSVQLRLGRIDTRLRATRIVVLDVARRWDAERTADDVGLAKIVATSAAVDATDEALRIAGGPGFLSGRLERALRDARAGLINPPLEDVAVAGFARQLLQRLEGP